MESLFLKFCIILFFCKIEWPTCISADDYDYGSYDYYPLNFTGPFTDEDHFEAGSFNAKLHDYMDFLTNIFGSKNEVESKIFDEYEDNYWRLDSLKYTIEQQMGKTGQTRSKHGAMIIELFTDEMNSIVISNATKKLHDQLIESSPLFYCAIGRKRTDETYKFLSQGYACGETIAHLWSDVALANFKNKNCNLDESLAELHKIGEIYREIHGPGYNETTEIYKIKLELIMILSRNYKYFHSVLCPAILENEGCDSMQQIICQKIKFGSVLDLTQSIEIYSKNHPPTSASEMLILLEIQQKLGDISSAITMSKYQRVSPTQARGMLNSYLGIVDTVIGDTSVQVWKEGSQTRTGGQLHQLLLRNEAIVGAATDAILPINSRPQKADVNKTKLSVQMLSIPATNEENSQTGNVEFSFDDVRIWADNLDTTLPEHKVYALHYKSWKEMINNINSEFVENSTAQLPPRSFIGKGGIVSLGTRAGKKKISVPVKYKINFSEDQHLVTADGEYIGHRCLACEFLDEETKTWANSGCHVTHVDRDGITCHCNHTTNFAAFMMPFKAEFNTTQEQQLWLDIVEYAGSILSVIGLLLSFLIFCKVRNTVRNERIRAHMNLVIALLFVHLIQLGADYAVYNDTLCVITTLFTHYFLLASFMWMLVEGIFLYLYVVQVFVHSMFERLWWMYAIGWGVPIVIISVAAGYGLPTGTYVQQKSPAPNYCEPTQLLYPPLPEGPSNVVCWLDTESGMTWSFILPAMLVILFNLVILCKVVQVLVKLSDRSSAMKSSQASKSISYHPRNGSFQTNSSLQPKFENKQRPSIKADTLPVTPMLGCSRDSISQMEGLHGHVVTRGSHSRTSSQCYQQMKATERPRTVSSITVNDSHFRKDVKAAVKGAAVLLPILGIPWICGMLGYKSYALTVIFVVLNSLQGIAIFLVYCVFNGEVWRALKRQVQLYRIQHGHQERGRSSSTSSIRAALNRGMLRSWRRRSTAVTTLSATQTV